MQQERVRAILIDEGRIILIRRVKPNVIYWVFPGGGVEAGEDHATALKRECREELGVEIEILDLLWQRKLPASVANQVEYFYLCHPTGGKLGTGTGPEFSEQSHYEGSHEIEAVPLTDIRGMELLPKEVRDLVHKRFSKS